jgi:hypothetical protein
MSGLRSYTTATGYAVRYRTLPPDFLPALRARVRAEHAADEPPIPVVTVETAPGQSADVPIDPAGALPADPERAALVVAYRKVLGAWEASVIAAITESLKAVLVRTVQFEVDAAAVQDVRAIYGAAGLPLPDDDRAVMLWHVILTDAIDQAAITQSLAGLSVEEAAQQARITFRRALEGASA